MNKKNGLMVIAAALLCACFVSCENPVIHKWWVQAEPEPEDFDYVAIMKDVPILIYEAIMEEKVVYEYVYEYIKEYYPEYVYVEKPLPPEIILQHLTILGIEFVIFAGDSTEFGGENIYPHPAGVHGPNGYTDLTVQERHNNEAHVVSMAAELTGHDRYMMILHGHANPTTSPGDPGYDEDIELLKNMSMDRAVSVESVLKEEFVKANGAGIEPGRITTKGYGGETVLSGASSSYAALNRRVEMILITITDEAVKEQPPVRIGPYKER